MTLLTTSQTLAIKDAPALRYRPLPAFGCADYLEKYAHLLEASGAFDKLQYGTAELRVNKGSVDLAGLAALGSAFAQLLTKSVADGNAKTIQSLIVDHCRMFAVEVQTDASVDKWLVLDGAESLAASGLDLGQMLDIVFALGGGVLRPLWKRLRLSDEAKRSESLKPSTSATPAS